MLYYIYYHHENDPDRLNPMFLTFEANTEQDARDAFHKDMREKEPGYNYIIDDIMED